MRRCQWTASDRAQTGAKQEPRQGVRVCKDVRVTEGRLRVAIVAEGGGTAEAAAACLAASSAAAAAAAAAVR